MNFSARQKRQRSVLWKAFFLFTLVSLLLVAADRISIRLGLDGSQSIAGDLLGGLIAGSLFYLYERRGMWRPMPWEPENFPGERIHGHSKPFFRHWLTTWRDRNEKTS
jgi:hypothetical protein